MAENSSKEEAIEHHGDAEGKKSRSRIVLDEVFPQLTLYRGREKLSRGKSALVVGLLYVSHSFSAWGDRMWGFVASLFLVILYPGSLLLPAIFGFLVQLSTAFFGTLVGDWVDANPRMRVVWMSLLIQNSLVALCSIVIALMFKLEWDVCRHVLIFACLVPLVIVFGSGANLASVANTISIEKDWVVVLADKNENTLAALNANMRRIDLLCKLLAPAITGIILQNTIPFDTTLIVAGWNVLSFFGELFLIWLVYRMIPTLAVKKTRRKQNTIDMTSLIEPEEEEGENEDDAVDEEKEIEGQTGEEDEEDKGDTLDLHPLPKTDQGCPCTCCGGNTPKICSHLLTPFTTIINGWRIYMRQEIALIGFAMASIYLTVLGFSGVTAAYFLTQGLRNDIIGVCQGIGAVFGVTGTVIYPFIRRRFGTVRSGLFGITTQWLILLLCIVAIAVPSNRISSKASGYYSADCSNYINTKPPGNDSDIPDSVSVYISETQCIATSSIESLPFSQMITTGFSTVMSSEISPTKTAPPLMPSASPSSSPRRFRNSGELKRFARDVSVSPPYYTSSLPPCTPETPPTTPPTTTPTSQTTSYSISSALIFMLLGVICCRIGLWTFDLAVQQLVQEKVKEEERGVVSGVMNAMNSIMDMLHYVLVIAAPRPEHFRILTVISVGMVTLGLILYMAYLRKVRGHIFHTRDCYHWFKRKLRGRRGRGGSVLLFADEDDPTSFVNVEVDGEEEEEAAELLENGDHEQSKDVRTLEQT